MSVAYRTALAVFDLEVKEWAAISGEWDIASQAATAEEAIENVYAAMDDILAHEGRDGLLPVAWEHLCEFVRCGSATMWDLRPDR